MEFAQNGRAAEIFSEGRAIWAISFDVISNYLPTLHHKTDAFELGYILKWVARYGHDIREFAFLDGPDAILPTHHFGGHGGCGLNCLRRRHAIFNQIRKFLRLASVWKWPASTSE